MAINATDTSVRHSHFRSRSAFLVVKSCVLAFMKSCHEDASRHLDPQLFVIIVRFLGEPDQDLPESTIRHVFSQLFSISWCSRLLADFYQYWCSVLLAALQEAERSRGGSIQSRGGPPPWK